MKNLKIAVLGGGTGLSSLLSGLKNYTNNITAIVTMADDGGSSGRLRRELGVLPPGDIRNCLVALADNGALLSKLFQYRFSAGDGLAGHSFGNLFLTAMSDLSGSFDKGIIESSKVLAIHGEVLPVTLANVNLSARLKNGKLIRGQNAISNTDQPIDKIMLIPMSRPPAGPKVLNAIKEAKVIVLGPGSLYTSVIPNLLVRGVKEAVVSSSAIKIYVCNIMTQAGETNNYPVSEHIKAIVNHGGKKIIDYVVANNGTVLQSLAKRYAYQNSYPVVIDTKQIDKLGIKLVTKNLISAKIFARHQPDKLAKTILEVARYL